MPASASRRIKMGLFLGIGLASAIAGLMAASRLGTVRYDLAAGGELQMVLIVMLGGTYIFGGRGVDPRHLSRRPGCSLSWPPA